MLSRLLRQTLFVLVHLVVNILVAVQNVYHRFWSKKQRLSRDELTKSDLRTILEHIPKLSKKPKHLVVLADTDNHSMDDLAHIVIWSLLAGVSYVSFHDITGELNEEKLFLDVERNKKGVPGYIKWANKPDLNGYTNGNIAHTVNINIFSSKDGRPRIADCLRQIAEGKILCKRDSDEFTAQEFEEALKFVYPSFPVPELALYTGTLCCTHGLLPWHIRLTEFIQLSLDHNFNVNNYIGALYKYNKCDQRFGK